MNLSHKQSAWGTLFSAALLASPLASCTEEPLPRPNVIVIMTDDQGYGDLAVHGNPIIKTPHLDRLHAESVRFTDFHVDSFCAPTRAALLTGRMSERTHVRTTVLKRNFLNREETTMAEFFQASGYKTGQFGKWHIGNNYPYRPMDRGFDRWVGQGAGIGTASDYWGNDRLDDHYYYDGEWQQIDGFNTDVFFDEAMKFIEESGEEPFFMYLATYTPHGPMNILPEWRRQYLGYGDPPKVRFWGDTWDLYAILTRFDYNIGRLRAFLEENNLHENTLLVFTTDNGTSDGDKVFNAGMRGRKGQMFEGGHRVPLFMHWPAGGLQGGRDVDRFSWHFDLLPTFIELCQLETPERGHLPFDGRSLKPLLYDAHAQWDDRVVFLHQQNVREVPVKGQNSLVATERWRLINRNALFDIKLDPGQNYNVASEHPDVVAELGSLYDAYWEELGMEAYPYQRPIIGTPYQKTTWLTTEDWIREDNMPSWQQYHVLPAEPKQGFWPVEIAKDGRYAFDVRRWPRELNHPVTAGLPEEVNPRITTLGEPLRRSEGRAIPVVEIRLEVGDQSVQRRVTEGDVGADFALNLNAGATEVRAWMVDEEGNEQSAYYIYVTGLD